MNHGVDIDASIQVRPLKRSLIDVRCYWQPHPAGAPEDSTLDVVAVHADVVSRFAVPGRAVFRPGLDRLDGVRDELPQTEREPGEGDDIEF